MDKHGLVLVQKVQLQKLKDKLSKEYNMTVSEAINRGICISCKEDWRNKYYSDAGRREYKISGLCEICFDNMFN